MDIKERIKLEVGKEMTEDEIDTFLDKLENVKEFTHQELEEAIRWLSVVIYNIRKDLKKLIIYIMKHAKRSDDFDESDYEEFIELPFPDIDDRIIKIGDEEFEHGGFYT